MATPPTDRRARGGKGCRHLPIPPAAGNLPGPASGALLSVIGLTPCRPGLASTDLSLPSRPGRDTRRPGPGQGTRRAPAGSRSIRRRRPGRAGPLRVPPRQAAERTAANRPARTRPAPFAPAGSCIPCSYSPRQFINSREWLNWQMRDAVPNGPGMHYDPRPRGLGARKLPGTAGRRIPSRSIVTTAAFARVWRQSCSDASAQPVRLPRPRAGVLGASSLAVPGDRCDLPDRLRRSRLVTFPQYLLITVSAVITTFRLHLGRPAGPRRGAAYHREFRFPQVPRHLRRKDLAMNYQGFGAASALKPDKTRIWRIL